jgi:FtsP/CotA-like multicopper oxidase with cupredoxin domain
MVQTKRGKPPVPGPLIRVREGATVVLTLRNALGSALRVNGLCTRPSACDPVSIAAGASQEIRFTLNAPGTYFYWAATGPEAFNARHRRDIELHPVRFNFQRRNN